jgi:hypothetical protein
MSGFSRRRKCARAVKGACVAKIILSGMTALITLTGDVRSVLDGSALVRARIFVSARITEQHISTSVPHAIRHTGPSGFQGSTPCGSTGAILLHARRPSEPIRLGDGRSSYGRRFKAADGSRPSRPAV